MVQPISGLTRALELSSGRTVMVGAGFGAAAAAALPAPHRPAAQRNIPANSLKRTNSCIMSSQPTESRFTCRYPSAASVKLALPLAGNQVELRHYVSKTTTYPFMLLHGRHYGRDRVAARRKPHPR